MRTLRRRNPPGRTLAVYLCLMLVLGGALGWFGWQWLKQDRILDARRLEERLDSAADRMAAALRQDLTELDQLLDPATASSAALPAGVLSLQADSRAVVVRPSGGLVFLPLQPAVTEPPEAVFAAGERIELRDGDAAAAADLYRGLTRDADAGVRAGAWLRLGRCLRRLRRSEEALRAYEELARLGPVSAAGLPAELLARVARCSVLASEAKSGPAKAEAALLRKALWDGRWALSRPAWEFYLGEAESRLEIAAPSDAELDKRAFASGAEIVVRAWQSGPASRGARILRIEGRPVLVVWAGAPERLSAVLAGPAYLASRWTGAMRGPNLQGALLDADQSVLLGAANRGGPRTLRPALESGLPADLIVTRIDPASDAADARGRRRLLFAGLGMLGLILTAGSYFIIRSIGRERAVARLQSEFVSAVSHEFRTPLTSIRQLSEMLAKGRIDESGERRQSYEILSRESERLQRLVESLLDFGRIEARSFRYRFESIDPAVLVREIAASFAEQAAARGFSVETAIAADLPPVRADRDALTLAVWNLLDNAVKYSPDCRTVWIEAAREANRLALVVRDRGMGIPAAERKDIFKRFVRGAGSRAAHIQGTGIGLALADEIVKGHDGEIRLDSELGRGSSFTILLPLESKP